MSKTLGEILSSAEQYIHQKGGAYFLFVNCDYSKEGGLRSQTKCDVYLLGNEVNIFEYTPPDPDMCLMTEMPLVQEIVRAARLQKPEVTEDELVTCFKYYFRYDTFYNFDQSS